MIRYLLNDLPAEDEARFEEAYLRDGSLLEQVQAREEELIEDYVKGNLSDYERQRFERHYLASERRRARVDTARLLINACSLQPRAQVAAPAIIDSKLFSLRSHLRLLVRQPLALGLGASIALLLILGAGLVIELSRLRGHSTVVREEPAPLPVVSEERAALLRRTEEAERQLAYERGRLSEERAQSIALREKLRDVESRLDRLRQEQARSQRSKDRIVFLTLVPGIRDIEMQQRAVISTRTDFVELRVDLERQKASKPPPPSKPLPHSKVREPARDRARRPPPNFMDTVERLRSYRVALKTVEGVKEIWTQDGIKPRRSGSVRYVVVRVPADRFRAAGEQDFMLTLSVPNAEGNNDEEPESCYFRVSSR
jgi:hypothetical protein